MASRDGISIGSHQGRAGRHPSDSFYAAPCFIIHSASQLCRPDDQSEQNRTDGTGHATQNSATRHFLSFPPPAATAQPFVGGQSLLLLSSTSSRVCASNCVLGHCRSSGTTTDEYIFESAYMEWEKSLLLEFHSPSRFVHTLFSQSTHTHNIYKNHLERLFFRFVSSFDRPAFNKGPRRCRRIAEQPPGVYNA